jgi:hypothetical protein
MKLVLPPKAVDGARSNLVSMTPGIHKPHMLSKRKLNPKFPKN